MVSPWYVGGSGERSVGGNTTWLFVLLSFFLLDYPLPQNLSLLFWVLTTDGPTVPVTRLRPPLHCSLFTHTKDTDTLWSSKLSDTFIFLNPVANLTFTVYCYLLALNKRRQRHATASSQLKPGVSHESSAAGRPIQRQLSQPANQEA